LSRLAKKPIKLPPGVTAKNEGKFLIFKGPRGEMKTAVNPGIRVNIEGDNMWVEGAGGDGRTRALAGTAWSLLKNSVEGVASGFEKNLEIEGVGYRAQVEKGEIVLFLGYAEPVRMKIPDGVVVTVEKNSIKVSGIDKDLVGRVAAGIRAQKRPEPYKGKGIRYRGEVIKRKVGKKAGVATTAAA